MDAGNAAPQIRIHTAYCSAAVAAHRLHLAPSLLLGSRIPLLQAQLLCSGVATNLVSAAHHRWPSSSHNTAIVIIELQARARRESEAPDYLFFPSSSSGVHITEPRGRQSV
jgi:hypothetical protein